LTNENKIGYYGEIVRLMFNFLLNSVFLVYSFPYSKIGFSMENINNLILLSNNLVDVSFNKTSEKGKTASHALVGTLVSNLLSYGYVPSVKLMDVFRHSTVEQLGSIWKGLEPSLKEITGANRNMENFVVYKNFPKEVLEMSKGEYWINQIFMYLGAPNDWFYH
jgi:hypothetical protein